MKLIVAVCAFCVIANAVCYEIPCPSIIANGFEQQTEQTLKRQYSSLNDELKAVKSQYDDLLNNLKDSNKKLELAIKLNKQKLLKEKEMVFLLTQFNALQGVHNSIRAEDSK